MACLFFQASFPKLTQPQFIDLFFQGWWALGLSSGFLVLWKTLILEILILYFECSCDTCKGRKPSDLSFGMKSMSSGKKIKGRKNWEPFYNTYTILQFDFCVFSLIALVCPSKMICFIVIYYYFGDTILFEILTRSCVLKKIPYMSVRYCFIEDGLGNKYFLWQP